MFPVHVCMFVEGGSMGGWVKFLVDGCLSFELSFDRWIRCEVYDLVVYCVGKGVECCGYGIIWDV